MGNLILVRHGESELNKDGIFFGQLDPVLTENGKTQAKRTKERFEKIKYDEIYTSPLKRAYETAKIINEDQKILNVEEKLKELNFGILEGMTYKEIVEKYPDDAKELDENWKRYNYRTGESVEELQNRVIDFIKSLDTSNKNIVIVTHWGVINSILSYYLSENLDSYWKYAPNYASISIIEFSNKYPVLKGLNIGETSEII